MNPAPDRSTLCRLVRFKNARVAMVRLAAVFAVSVALGACELIVKCASLGRWAKARLCISISALSSRLMTVRSGRS